MKASPAVGIPPAPTAQALAIARGLPKILLHEHLDGGLRLPTLLELLQGRGMAVPADTPEALGAWFEAKAYAGSLVEYLKGFGLTIAAMADEAALSRVAFEAAEDARADGCVLAEFRVAPQLFSPVGVEAAVEALLDGLARSSLPTGLIVCGMRQHEPEEVAAVAEVALRYAGRGVVGFDLAGPEAGFPPSRHAGALARVRAAGLPITLHAGEADGPERVLEAVRLGARRIGHGVRLADWLDQSSQAPALDEIRTAGTHLEVCPTSNVQTGAAASIAAHPIARLWREGGLSLSFHTDNRLMSCTTLSTEAALLVGEGGLTWTELQAMQVQAARSSFLSESQRRAAEAAVLRWAAP